MEVLGAVAASLQLGGLAIKGTLATVKLVHDIKDVPERMEGLLQYLDREIDSVNSLLRSDSPVFKHLSPTQYARISVPATEARKAIEQIQKALEPLAIKAGKHVPDHQTRKHINKVWKSLRSLRLEQALQEKIEVLECLKGSLLRELQISGFETQSLLRQEIGTIRYEAASNHQSLVTLTAESEVRTNERLDVLGGKIQKQETILDQIHTKLVNGPPGPVPQLHFSSDAAEILLREQMQTPSQQMALLLDIRSRLVALSEQNIPQELISSTANEESCFDLDIRRSTAKLSRSRDVPIPVVEPLASTEPSRVFKRLRCTCKDDKTSGTWMCGRTNFRLKSGTATTCLVHGKTRSWSYSIEVKLTNPVIMGTLELTLGLLSGRTGWQMARPMHFRTTVKRSESPIFKLFDQFFKTRSQLHTDPQKSALPRLIQSASHPYRRWGIWDPGRTFKDLRTLVRRIHEVIGSGQGAGNDIDEYGSTLLRVSNRRFVSYSAHMIETLLTRTNKEIVFLAMALETEDLLHGNIDALCQLLTMAGMLDLDLGIKSHSFRFQMSRKFPRPPKAQLKTATMVAFDWLAKQPPTGSSQQFRVALSTDMIDAMIPEIQLCEPFGFQRSPIVWAMCNESEGLGLSGLALAVAQRSLPAVERYLETCHDEQWNANKGLKFGQKSPISLMELAVGWPEGLRLFVAKGHDISQAHDIAAYNKDPQSLAILLSTDRPIFSLGERRSFADLSKEVFHLEVKELQQRREAIRALAIEHLTQEEQDTMGFSEALAKGDLNFDPRLYNLLTEKIKVPAKLDCLEFRSPHCLSFIHCENLTRWEAQAMYDAGFTDVDALCLDLNSPLGELCNELEFRCVYMGNEMRSQWRDVVDWYVEHGANPYLDTVDDRLLRWPHLIFYIALSFMEYGSIDMKSTTTCDYTAVADECDCFCSRGCIPPMIFWNSYHNDLLKEYQFILPSQWHQYRLRRLRIWIKTWKLHRSDKESCYYKTTRLELFERLGMAHTCCKSVSTAGERKEKRSEDKASNQQLRTMLRKYRVARQMLCSWPIEKFWEAWWQIVDVILPPCKVDVEQTTINQIKLDPSYPSVGLLTPIVEGRQEQLAGALREAGFDGWDFDEVISYHLGRFLTRCHAWRTRREGWRRHRLMVRPKYRL